MERTNSVIDKLLVFLIGLTLNSVLFVPNKFKAYPLIAFFVIGLYFYLKNKKQSISLVNILLLGFPFVAFTISLIYSKSIPDGLKRLSTMLPVVVFPIIFSLLKSSHFNLSQSYFKKILLSFCLANFLFFIITFCYFWNQEFSFTETIVHYSNLINIRLGLFSQHPIYYSIYISLSLLFLIQFQIKTKNINEKILYLTLSILLLIVLGILMRKGPILYLIIAVFIYSLLKLSFKKGLIIAFGFLLISAFTIHYFPKYKDFNRFEELIKSDQFENSSSSTFIRYNIYKCSIIKIFENPVLGYGVGSTQKELDPCYINSNIDLSKKTYNSHNQYFSLALTSGLLSLLCFLVISTKSLFNMYKRNSILELSIFTLFLLNFLTENVLERENGAILYGLLVSLFYFFNYEKSS